MTTCPECGAVDLEGRFCGRCGGALPQEDERVSLSAVGGRPAVPRAVWVIALVVVVGAALALAWSFADGEVPSPAPEEGPAPRVRIGIPRPLIEEPDAGPRDAGLADAGAPDAGPARERAAGAGSHRRGRRTSEPAASRGTTSRSTTPPSTTPPSTTPPSTAPPSTTPPSTTPLSEELTAAAYLADARRHVAHTYRAPIQACFDAVMRRTPGVHGTIVVSMLPHADGRVASSRVVSDTTQQPAIAECIVRAARGWSLPPPPRRTLEIQLRYRI